MPRLHRRTTWVALGLTLFLLGCSQTEGRMIKQAESSYKKGDYEEAIFLCRRVLKRNPESGRALFLMGASRLQLDQDTEAEQLFGRSLALDGATKEELAALYERAGIVDALAGSPTRAKLRLHTAHRLDQNLQLGPYDFLLGDAYYDRGSHEQAAEAYERALRARPDTSVAERALFRLGESYEATGRHDEARDVYGRYLAHYPRGERKDQVLSSLQGLYFSRARIEYEQGNYEDCLPLLEEILRYTENPLMRDRTTFLLGEVYEGQGDFARARDMYLRIVSSPQVGSLRIRERAVDKLEQFESIGLP